MSRISVCINICKSCEYIGKSDVERRLKWFAHKTTTGNCFWAVTDMKAIDMDAATRNKYARDKASGQRPENGGTGN